MQLHISILHFQISGLKNQGDLLMHVSSTVYSAIHLFLSVFPYN